MPDSLSDRLALWYTTEKYRYDFRRERNPYRTWITEIFLQQTQIAAGKEKLKTFLKRFPDIKTLAAGPVADVLTAFQGMGYYSRARNMFKAAQYIVKNHSGIVPIAYADLKQIPGIGHYTAAIVASIHGGEKTLALDANHARVLSRLCAISHPQGGQKFRVAAMLAAQPFFASPMQPGDVNEALMQWGQTICKKNPLCEKCFAANECEAFAKGRQKDFPRKAARSAQIDIPWLMFIHRKGNKYQVFEGGDEFPFLKGELLFPGHLTLPLKSPKTDTAAFSLPRKIDEKILRAALRNGHNLPVDFRHTITRYKISVKMLMAKNELAGGRYLTPAELKQSCHSSLMQKAIQRLDKLEFS